MDTLPEELLFSLLYLSKYDDLINLFTTTSQFNFIRNDPIFWRNKLEFDFGNIPERYDIGNYEFSYMMMYIDTLEGNKFPRWAKNFIITILNDHRQNLPKLWRWAHSVYLKYNNLIDDEGQMLVEFSSRIDIRNLMPTNYSRKCQRDNKPSIIPYDQVLNFVTAQVPVVKYFGNGIIYFITCKNKYIHITRDNIPCCSSTISGNRISGIDLTQEDISHLYRFG